MGAANLIFLSLKLLEYEYKLSTDRVAHFLLIEEPEAHIHTHIQMTLFEKYGYEKTQVIVSTHSTHVSSASKIRSVNILSKGFQEAHVFQPSFGIDNTECERIERYLDAVRSTLLFAKGIMIVEGDAEMILIPNLIKKVLGISLDELGVSLINMSSTVFQNIARIFHDDRVRRRCAIITDLDTSIYELPDDPENDNTAQSDRRKSEEAGKLRNEKLEEFCGGNRWVKAFYAPHTFEVDFLMSDNSREIIDTLPGIYKQNRSIERSEERLKDNNIKVAGKEILRLANKVGKGWFALMVSENIYSDTYITDYILKSLAFACQEIINNSTLRAMGIYRIEDRKKDSGFKELYGEIKDLKDLPAKDFIKIYTETLSDDQLTKFIEYIKKRP